MSQPENRKSDSSDVLIKKLRDYEVIRVLGRGGMGIVYLVRHSLTQRIEALKVLRPSTADRPRVRERFLREVQVAAKLDHPNVVKTFTAVQAGGVLGLVMEYVKGQDLETWVRKSGPLTVSAAATVVGQAALGLQHAADHGLTHRDIKPSNILVTKIDGKLVAKLSDFGLSKVDEDVADNSLTADGRLLGTPDYMAPEQGLDAANSTSAADIYGLGCTLYFALTGRPPYSATSPLGVLRMHIQAPIPDVSTIRGDIPIELSHAVMRMMQKEPRDRYATAADVARAILPFAAKSIEVRSSTNESTAVTSRPERQDGLLINGPDEIVQQDEYRPPIRTLRNTRKGNGAARAFSLCLQIAMPIALALFVIYVLRPWHQSTGNADGTLLVKELSAGTSIDIDGTIKVGADPIDNPVREIRLSPGRHKLKILNGNVVVTERTVEIEPNRTVEFSLSYRRGSQIAPRPQAVTNNEPKQFATERPAANATQETREVVSAEQAPSLIDVPPTTASPEPVSNTPLEAPRTVLQNADWLVEHERQLSGLDPNSRNLFILPKAVTGLDNEVAAAVGDVPKAWDLRTGFPQQFFSPFPLSGLFIANNEKSVVYFNEYKCEVWTVTKPRPAKWFWTPDTRDVKRVFAMSADSRYLACADFNGAYIRWELATKSVAAKMTAKRPTTGNDVQAIYLTPKLDKVLCVSGTGTVSCWNASDGEELGTIAASTREITSVHITNAGRKAVVVYEDGAIETRGIPKLELLSQLDLKVKNVTNSAYGNQLWALVEDGKNVQLIDTLNTSIIGTVECPADLNVNCLAVSPDARWAAVGYTSGLVNVVKLRKAQQTTPATEADSTSKSLTETATNN